MITVGSEVGWLWIGTLITGTVLEVHATRHEIISKGKRIVRKGTEQDPALVIMHSNGTYVLKLQHEVQLLT